MPVNRFETPGEPPDGSSAATDDEPRGGPEALERLQRQFEELGEYARLYLAAKGDAYRASLRRLGMWLAAGVVALVVLIAVLSTAAAMAVLGTADIVGRALGNRPGAGFVVTGLGLLAIFGFALVAVMIILARSARKRTFQKYATRHRSQRERFGHDAAQRAAARQSERS